MYCAKEESVDRDSPDGCSSIGKVAQWRPKGYELNLYNQEWHLVNLDSRDMYEVTER